MDNKRNVSENGHLDHRDVLMYDLKINMMHKYQLILTIIEPNGRAVLIMFDLILTIINHFTKVYVYRVRSCASEHKDMLLYDIKINMTRTLCVDIYF